MNRNVTTKLYRGTTEMKKGDKKMKGCAAFNSFQAFQPQDESGNR